MKKGLIILAASILTLTATAHACSGKKTKSNSTVQSTQTQQEKPQG